MEGIFWSLNERLKLYLGQQTTKCDQGIFTSGLQVIHDYTNQTIKQYS